MGQTDCGDNGRFAGHSVIGLVVRQCFSRSPLAYFCTYRTNSKVSSVVAGCGSLVSRERKLSAGIGLAVRQSAILTLRRTILLMIAIILQA